MFVSPGEITTILQDAVFTVVFSAAPMLIVAIIVGLTVSIFQATTQINEQSLSFVPKILSVLFTLVFFSGFIFSMVGGFVTRLFDRMGALFS